VIAVAPICHKLAFGDPHYGLTTGKGFELESRFVAVGRRPRARISALLDVGWGSRSTVSSNSAYEWMSASTPKSTRSRNMSHGPTIDVLECVFEEG
jgi:hypothetical protein